MGERGRGRAGGVSRRVSRSVSRRVSHPEANASGSPNVSGSPIASGSPSPMLRLLYLRPCVAQGRRAVQHEPLACRVLRVHAEVAQALELIPASRRGVLQARLQVAGVDRLERLRSEERREVGALGYVVRGFLGEQ